MKLAHFDTLNSLAPTPYCPKHLYISAGDFNAVLHPEQRLPRRGDFWHSEKNRELTRHIEKHDLTEVVDHYNETLTYYTYKSDTNGALSKIDHLLFNPAAMTHAVTAGHIQTNPYIPSDHGILWACLSRKKLNIKIERDTENEELPDQPLARPNYHKSGEFTSSSSPGFALRFTFGNSEPGRIPQGEPVTFLDQNGYRPDMLTDSSKHRQALRAAYTRHDIDCGTKMTPPLTLRDCVAWRAQTRQVQGFLKKGS